MRWVKEIFPPRARFRWLLMTMRLSKSSFTGTARTDVAVGSSSEAFMFFATAPAGSRRVTYSGPWGAPPAGAAFGCAGAGAATAGLGAAGAATGAGAGAAWGGAWRAAGGTEAAGAAGADVVVPAAPAAAVPAGAEAAGAPGL